MIGVPTSARANGALGSSALSKLLEELLKSHASVLVITDADGLAGITSVTIKRVPSDALKSAKIEVALVTLH